MRRAGVLYMAASAVFFSGMSALVKLAGHRLPAGEIVLVRVILTLILSLVMVRRAGLSPWGTRRGALVLRGLLGFTALSCYYWTLTTLPLAVATTIYFVAPIVTAIAAAIILHERSGWAAVVAIALGFAGTLMVAQPGTGAVDPVATLIAVAGAVSSGFAYVTVRQLSREEDPLVIVFYFPLVALPLSIPWAVSHAIWPTAREWLVLGGIGVLTQAAQVCLTRGLSLERAGRASAVGYLQVVLSMIWGITLFGEVPAGATIAGAALIIAGTAVVASTSGVSGTRPGTGQARPKTGQG